MHNYLVKLAILLAVVVCLNRLLKVSFSTPFSRWSRIPPWLLPVVELFETDGWTVIPAVILAAVWQIAESH